jgi:phospholipid-binding lipoprotein MlaA
MVGREMGRKAGISSALLAVLLSLMAAGCASSDNKEAAAADDPLEPMNRFFFSFNQTLDRNAALPAASFYVSTVPNPLRTGVHNFLSNLDGPVDFVNSMLQFHLEEAGGAISRFGINSTLGLGGIFDIATGWGLPEEQEDFGQTLGVYGLGQGPYLVLPLRGPSAVRDFAGSYVDGYFSPLYYVRYSGRQYVGLVRASLGSVDNRSANIMTFREIERSSVDFYATMRDFYRQRRDNAIRNGKPDMETLPDL